MFFKFIITSLVYFSHVDALIHSFSHLHKLPLLGNYLAIKRCIYHEKTEPSRAVIHITNKDAYDKASYDHHLLKHLSDGDYRRKQLFESHTELLNGTQNLTHLNVLITHFITDLLNEYTLYFFELLPALYLEDDLRRNLHRFLEAFQQKLIELFKVSMISIIDASPRSRILILLNSVQFRVMVDKMVQLCNILSLEYEFEKLEHVMKSANDERFTRVATWTVVHSEALKRGLVMLSRMLVIAALNNLVVPLLFKFLLQIIPRDFPGYSILQYLLRCFNISFK
ncbi:Conserved hypothetical protein [Theileria orientalis strain Shintoku]|uniref:Uncharacterized protein n=1 Tax=Theileria orientalis strain Shintoku TaxID=869250 RepID=J4DP23_THEOR|nr:Conserved hypothetical protein [Theileria orientalis strain Shintoku]BAM39959.1 Conserved hypothetical protein [Theileria orientalis strain Shintoku]|eukprot:XP_009690260.1 Conserved hypothetical protein [Theileria orientalis strain Shintoku]